MSATHPSPPHPTLPSTLERMGASGFKGKGGRKKGREISMCGCFSPGSHWGPALQPRHVPRLGIKPVTLCFTGRAQSTELQQPGHGSLLNTHASTWAYKGTSSDPQIHSCSCLSLHVVLSPGTFTVYRKSLINIQPFLTFGFLPS